MADGHRGWDQFVTVAFEGMTEFVPHQTGNTKVTINAQIAGKKIMKGLAGAQGQGGHGGLSGKDVLIHAEGKPAQAVKLLEHKIVWQIVNGNPVPVTAGWSDKG